MTLQNAITDVEGILVGNSCDHEIKTGVTALICENPSVASVHVMGGAPGTRDTELLAPENFVQHVDGLFLSGGSAFGLDAGGGMQAAFREMGRGFEVGDQKIPITPGAILFDMVNGGNKDWGQYSPYQTLGFEAAQMAGKQFETGSAGAGFGALVAGLKGGLGTASMRMDNGITIGALAAVNALGSPVMGNSGNFWAAPFEQGSEFGGLGLPTPMPEDVNQLNIKFRDQLKAGTNTTIAIIATDASLTKAEAKRLAIASHDGFARALWPAHTPMDGDSVFAVATGTRSRLKNEDEWLDIGASASAVMARAIARGIYDASADKNDIFPCWKEHYGTKFGA